MAMNVLVAKFGGQSMCNVLRGLMPCAVLTSAMLPVPGLAEEVTSVDAEQAYEYVQAEDAFLLDVRTRAELQFVGAPDPMDMHVPFMRMTTPFEWDSDASIWRMEPNESFVADVDAALDAAGATTSDRVVVICRSGSRSLEAAKQLQEADYTDVIHVDDGFEGDRDASGYRRMNGWLNAGLPILDALPADRVYREKDRN
ncbi:MAG: sulfurtransferase [Spiribacter salinus]|uniref:Sulfurtransferase n=1 Tax=Spiribacter salinus TaxID=1335746 RepID=A0A540VNX4_9GAMM|nr:MAG: sulfurtransferase [Spiribacter salinus]